MEKTKYKKIVDKYTPSEPRLRNAIIAFLIGRNNLILVDTPYIID